MQTWLQQILRQFGGVLKYHGIKDITNVEGRGEVVEPRLQLYCKRADFGVKCGAEWKSDYFTACPKCGSKRFVHKRQPDYKSPQKQHGPANEGIRAGKEASG